MNKKATIVVKIAFNMKKKSEISREPCGRGRQDWDALTCVCGDFHLPFSICHQPYLPFAISACICKWSKDENVIPTLI